MVFDFAIISTINKIAMTRNKIMTLIIGFYLSVSLYGQSVEFAYDENGNRVSRSLVVELLRSGAGDLMVNNSKNKELKENLAIEDTGTGEISAIVYPNPGKGLLKVDITNMPLSSKSELALFDISGNALILKRNFESYLEIDISHFKDGIYFMRIKINEKVFDWKIIKND